MILNGILTHWQPEPQNCILCCRAEASQRHAAHTHLKYTHFDDASCLLLYNKWALNKNYKSQPWQRRHFIFFFLKYMRKSRGQCRLSNGLCYFWFKSYVSGTQKCGRSKTKRNLFFSLLLNSFIKYRKNKRIL